MNPTKYRLFAEAVDIGEQAQNDVYITVTMRLMSTLPNGNGHVVEREFMQGVVDDPEFYNATPVKVDVDALLSGKPLGHLFDRCRKEWLAQQIGSITEFWLEDITGQTVLYGKARIEKSRADVVNAIRYLYECGKLFFSFEITAMDIATDENTGLIHIGKSDRNHLTAMCVVSVPAYEGATAITFVAEMENENMDNENINITTPDIEPAQVQASEIENETEKAKDENIIEAECAKDEKKDAAEETDEENKELDEEEKPPFWEKEAELETLKAELTELREFKASIEAEKLAAEKAEKAYKLKIGAEKLGIDVEAMKDSIANLDYEAIFASLTSKDVDTSETQITVNPLVGDGMALKSGRWDGYITDASGLGE